MVTQMCLMMPAPLISARIGGGMGFDAQAVGVSPRPVIAGYALAGIGFGLDQLVEEIGAQNRRGNRER